MTQSRWPFAASPRKQDWCSVGWAPCQLAGRCFPTIKQELCHISHLITGFFTGRAEWESPADGSIWQITPAVTLKGSISRAGEERTNSTKCAIHLHRKWAAKINVGNLALTQADVSPSGVSWKPLFLSPWRYVYPYPYRWQVLYADMT